MTPGPAPVPRAVPVLLPHDGIQFGEGHRRRDAFRESGHQHSSARRGHRKPELPCEAGRESFRHHADDRVGPTGADAEHGVEFDFAAHDAGVTREVALPEQVADDHDVCGARFVVSLEHPPEERRRVDQSQRV